jgi:hypothetical protein
MPFVKFETNADDVARAYQAAAKAANAKATKGLRQAAKDIVLPTVRAAVKGKLPGVTSAGATAKGAYVRQTHPGAALDDFGGVRNDTIAPVSAKELSTPAGPRQVVKGPRKYKGAHVWDPAVNRVRPQMNEAAQKIVLEAFKEQGFKVSG